MKQFSFVFFIIIMLVMTYIPSIHAALNGYCYNLKDFTMGFQNWCKGNGQQIHGLWPNPDCICGNEEQFNINSVDPQTRSLMNEHWNSCGQGNSELWSHEWDKHGKCSGLTQAEYFSVAVKLFLDLKGKCKDTCKINVSTMTVRAMLAAPDSEKKETVVDDDLSSESIGFEFFEAFLIISIFCCCGFIAKAFFPHLQNTSIPRIVEKGYSNRDAEVEIAMMPFMNNDLQTHNIEEESSLRV